MPKCHGTRLKDEVLSVKIQYKSIADCSDMMVNDLYNFLDGIDDEIVAIII